MYFTQINSSYWVTHSICKLKVLVLLALCNLWALKDTGYKCWVQWPTDLMVMDEVQNVSASCFIVKIHMSWYLVLSMCFSHTRLLSASPKDPWSSLSCYWSCLFPLYILPWKGFYPFLHIWILSNIQGLKSVPLVWEPFRSPVLFFINFPCFSFLSPSVSHYSYLGTCLAFLLVSEPLERETEPGNLIFFYCARTFPPFSFTIYLSLAAVLRTVRQLPLHSCISVLIKEKCDVLGTKVFILRKNFLGKVSILFKKKQNSSLLWLPFIGLAVWHHTGHCG